MATNKLSGSERKKQVTQIVEECRQIALDYIKKWTPQNPQWETIEGCAYLRLSTEDQVRVEKGSLEQQIHIAVHEVQVRSQADATNYRITKFFIEPGITGRHDNRPEFSTMKQEIDRGKYKFVVFKELARIAREVTIWKEFFRLCNKKSTQIFIRNFPINPNDPTQILQLDILAAFAEYESNQTSRRVRESNFSAMVTSGKFNCTKPTLGLDQMTVNGEPKAGFYVPNTQELETVKWIMEKFVLYGSYQRLLEEIDRLGVKNKGEKNFNRSTLQKLLTNRRYIGKWELNTKNRENKAKKLMPYERYVEVSLPHGSVIDLDLWDRVQHTVQRISGSKTKNTKIKKVFLLSGILKLQSDGSSFHGTGATGRVGRKNYYFNSKHKIRLSAEDIENEAKKTVAQIIRSSKPFQEAITQKSLATETLKQFLDSQSRKISAELVAINGRKQAAARRFDLLSKDATENDLALYRDEYKSEIERIKLEFEEHQRAQTNLDLQRERLSTNEIAISELINRAENTQTRIEAQDPVALKNAYRELFEAVYVNLSPSEGSAVLNFVLRGHQSAAITLEENGSVVEKMVGSEGLEPPIRRL
ncbi:MAG: recombinase family protein [Pseudobdellovibrionaceae bacterium]